MQVSSTHIEPRRGEVIAFFLLAFAWTWACWGSFVAVSAGYVSLPISQESLATLGQFGPFAAAVAVTWFGRGRVGLREFFGRFVRWRAHPGWVAVSLLLIPALMMGAILLHAAIYGTLATLEFRERPGTLPAHFVYTLLLCGPLGEEPGWRGFALPRLQARYGPDMGSVALGVLWALWHLPLWWMYDKPMPFALYIASAVLMTYLFTWLFNHTSGSVLYALLFHASMNTAGTRLPEVPAHYCWVAVLLVAVLAVFLFDLLRKAREAKGAEPAIETA